jgi:MFS family permease
LPAGIWALGLGSLFMDISSELIHSLLPAFIVTVLGASMVTIGLIEGVAEATAAVTKVFSGALSDYLGKRKFLLVLGYALAAFTKPIFPLAPSIGWVSHRGGPRAGFRRITAACLCRRCAVGGAYGAHARSVVEARGGHRAGGAARHGVRRVQPGQRRRAPARERHCRCPLECGWRLGGVPGRGGVRCSDGSRVALC